MPANAPPNVGRCTCAGRQATGSGIPALFRIVSRRNLVLAPVVLLMEDPMGLILALLAAVVGPLWTAPDLRSVADRAHAWSVHVTARGADETVTASGVIIRGGLVLTDLHGLLSKQPDGTIAPAEIVVDVAGVGALPAVLAGADVALGIAVLLLPDAARDLPGADIA